MSVEYLEVSGNLSIHNGMGSKKGRVLPVLFQSPHPAASRLTGHFRAADNEVSTIAMSTGQLARNRTLSMGSGRSSTGRNASLADFSLAPSSLVRDFDPCDATASMFLYAQGNSVVVAHHDTLTIERRFSRHTEEVQLLAVDNVSERGAGRLVISYDAGQTAIVWDLMTGDEVARFASYNNLSVAAWMRNGNVAFGMLAFDCSKWEDCTCYPSSISRWDCGYQLNAPFRFLSETNFDQEMRREM